MGKLFDLVRKTLSWDIKGVWRTERFNLYAKLIGECNIMLDVGCGECRITQFISAKTTYLGVDVNREALRMHIERGKLILADARFLPIRGNSVDGVLCAELVEHVSARNGKKILKEIHRVLKKDGKLVLSTPNKNDLLSRVQRKLGFKRTWAENISGHVYLYEAENLDSLVRGNGFALVATAKFLVLGSFLLSSLFYPIIKRVSLAFPVDLHTFLIRVCVKQ